MVEVSAWPSVQAQCFYWVARLHHTVQERTSWYSSTTALSYNGILEHSCTPVVMNGTTTTGSSTSNAPVQYSEYARTAAYGLLRGDWGQDGIGRRKSGCLFDCCPRARAPVTAPTICTETLNVLLL